MDRDTIHPAARETTKEEVQLPDASDRRHPPNRTAHEPVEHAPAARTDRESSATEIRLDRREHPRCESLVSPFEVEHELCLVTRRGEHLVQLQSRTPRCDDLPPVPEYGQGAYGLQVTDLEPPAEEPNVSL